MRRAALIPISASEEKPDADGVQAQRAPANQSARRHSFATWYRLAAATRGRGNEFVKAYMTVSPVDSLACAATYAKEGPLTVYQAYLAWAQLYAS